MHILNQFALSTCGILTGWSEFAVGVILLAPAAPLTYLPPVWLLEETATGTATGTIMPSFLGRRRWDSKRRRAICTPGNSAHCYAGVGSRWAASRYVVRVDNRESGWADLQSWWCSCCCPCRSHGLAKGISIGIRAGLAEQRSRHLSSLRIKMILQLLCRFSHDEPGGLIRHVVYVPLASFGVPSIAEGCISSGGFSWSGVPVVIWCHPVEKIPFFFRDWVVLVEIERYPWLSIGHSGERGHSVGGGRNFIGKYSSGELAMDSICILLDFGLISMLCFLIIGIAILTALLCVLIIDIVLLGLIIRITSGSYTQLKAHLFIRWRIAWNRYIGKR